MIALVCLRGKNSKDTWRQLLGVEAPTINVPLAGKTDVPLRLVAEYVHLGNTVTTQPPIWPTYKPRRPPRIPSSRAFGRPYSEIQSWSAMRRSDWSRPWSLRRVASVPVFGCHGHRRKVDVSTRLSLNTGAKACRPINGHGIKFLDELDVCALLRSLVPKSTGMWTQSVSFLLSLRLAPAISNQHYLRRDWLQQAFDALRQVQACLGVTEAPPHSQFAGLQPYRQAKLAWPPFCADTPNTVSCDTARDERTL